MPDRPATWDDIVRHEATKARVPPTLALALMQQESSGRPDAVSDVGAQGLFQLMPATAKTLGIDPADPIQNIRGGVTYLRQQLDAVGGDVQQALARYHGGPDLRQHGPKTAAYVQGILGRLQGGQGAPAAPGAAQAAPAPVAPPAPARAAAGPVGAPPPPITSIPLQRPQDLIQRPAGPVAGLEPQPGASSSLTLQPRTDRSFTESLAASVDPRTAEGRRNIAGGVGAGVATAVTGGIAAPVIGALAGGMMAESGEQLVGNKPPSSAAVVGRGAEQAAYDAGGQLALWPVRAVGRRVVGSRVGRAAAEHLGAAKQAIVDQTAAAIDAARSSVRSARATMSGAIDSARTGVQASRSAMQGATAGAKAATAKDVAGLEGQLAAQGVGAPPPSVTGRAANAVIQGPAKTARELAGEAVEEAAQRGPKVDITALKAEAQRILSSEIKPSAVAFPRGGESPAAAGAEALQAAGVTPEMVARMAPHDQAAIQSLVTSAQESAESNLIKHPAMGVLSRILNAEDAVAFADAHAFKRELDEAVGTAWDRSVSKRVTNITKTLRTNLRAALDYGPYNAATQKYAAIAPLYTKEMAPRLRKLAETRPEALIEMIKGNQPTPLRMLREVLTTQAAEGGDAAGGQAAWDMVRSTWTSEKLLRSGLDGVADRLAKLDPEFVQVMYGDKSGQQVLANLRTITTAYDQALAREPQAIAGAKAGYDVARQQGAQAIRGARQTFEGARTAGEQAIDAARTSKRTAITGLRDEATRFAKSSLSPRGVSDEVGADVLRAISVPNTFWGARSIIRLIFRGPKGKDLLEWSIYSSANTQRLVQALTSGVPGEALGELARTISTPAKDGTGFDRRPIGAAPPSPSTRVGAPPPSPR